jgi:hypothetical protein
MPKWTRPLTFVAALLALAALFFIWRGARRGPSASAPAPSAEASAEANAAPGPRSPPGRAGWSSRAPIRLGEGSADRDEALTSGAFEGRVLSWGTGRGVGGATISFTHDGQASSIVAGADGSFRFVPPEPGAYQIAMVTGEGHLPFAPAFGQSPLSLTARPGERIRDIRLYLEAAVKYVGVVRSPSGDPVKGASVRLFDEDGGEARVAPLPDRFTSDERGEFTFSAPEDTILEARHPDYAPGRAGLSLTAQAARRVTLRLGPKVDPPPPSGVIAGRVVDSKGAPVLGARVRAIASSPRLPAARDRAPILRPEAMTDEAGRFSLEDLSEPEYTVVAHFEELAPATAKGVKVGSQDLTLTLSAGAALRGTVRDEKDSAPVASFTIVVAARRGPLEREVVVTKAVLDASGRYEVSGLVPGEYTVIAAAHGFAASRDAAFTVPDPAADPPPVDIKLTRGGRVTGVVVEEGSKNPIEGARVSVEGIAGSGPQAASVLASITTDAAGKFEMQGLGAGLRSITIVAEGHHGRIVSGLAVTEGGDVGPITVELAKTKEGEEPKIELTGIGAVLSPREDALVVGEALPGGGAQEAGIVAGDALLAIDGAAIVDIGFEAAVQRIRGPEGSRVDLLVRRAAGGDPAVVSVTRRRIRP